MEDVALQCTPANLTHGGQQSQRSLSRDVSSELFIGKVKGCCRALEMCNSAGHESELCHCNGNALLFHFFSKLYLRLGNVVSERQID